MLALFHEYGIHATWATVGLLLADDRQEIEAAISRVDPRYHDTRLLPDLAKVGANERDDPYHYGGSLVEHILETAGQEIGSHSAIHLNASAPGITSKTFERDTEVSVEMSARRGIRPRSYVFARNQVVPAYSAILFRHGFHAYRAKQGGWAHRATGRWRRHPLVRASRLLDDMIAPPSKSLARWPAPATPTEIPSSGFLRPAGLPARVDNRLVARWKRVLQSAAATGQIVHLWWHPHNFGSHTERNLSRLRTLLTTFHELQDSHGMRSLTMSEVTAHQP